MELIREPLHVDFYIDSKRRTDKERAAVSQHIQEYKKCYVLSLQLRTATYGSISTIVCGNDFPENLLYLHPIKLSKWGN